MIQRCGNESLESVAEVITVFGTGNDEPGSDAMLLQDTAVTCEPMEVLVVEKPEHWSRLF
jgi:hypothetical protein